MYGGCMEVNQGCMEGVCRCMEVSQGCMEGVWR